MTWCIVETPDGTDEIDAGAMSFDGGSLILFSDPDRRVPKAAYGPYGWLHWRWKERNDGKVQAES